MEAVCGREVTRALHVVRGQERQVSLPRGELLGSAPVPLPAMLWPGAFRVVPGRASPPLRAGRQDSGYTTEYVAQSCLELDPQCMSLTDTERSLLLAGLFELWVARFEDTDLVDG